MFISGGWEASQPSKRMNTDKQLQGIRLDDVLEKRRLDQALNAKEFAVVTGVSYSKAREWFHLPGFPVIRGMVFWQDFVRWRTAQNKFGDHAQTPVERGCEPIRPVDLPPRAAGILNEV
jgi:hypothetical protein